ncbi:hypothetical protein JCM11491_005012 [Sporobolomyces phaffii]
MCGIVLRIRPISPRVDRESREGARRDQSTRDDDDDDDEWDSLVAAVRDRGPDAVNSVTVTTRTLQLDFHATVLHLRGTSVTPQPFHSPASGNVLLWNGEIFDSPLLPVGIDENDGDKLFRLIERDGFAQTMRTLDGPHAVVYYDHAASRVYFARDCLGRRSLLKRQPTRRGELVLTSTAPRRRRVPDDDGPREGGEWHEVACDGVWQVDLDQLAASASDDDDDDDDDDERSRKEDEWLTLDRRFYPGESPASDSLVYPFGRLNRAVPSSIGSLLAMTRSFPPLPVLSRRYLDLLSTFKSLLVESVRQRVLTIPIPASPSPYPSSSPPPRVGILFSGGLDCTTLALLVDEVLPKGEAIDLINVSFENPRKVDLARGGLGPGGINNNNNKKKKKKKETKKERQDRIKREENGEPEPDAVAAEQPPIPTTTTTTTADETNDEFPLPKSSSSSSSIYDVPDRVTGLETYGELERVRPDRRWNFVKVDVPYHEMLLHRDTVVDLMYPQDTVMDLSIAIAFYFAARGQGTLHRPHSRPRTDSTHDDDDDDDDGDVAYTSTARVLLSGLGADELLGGYARHRRAYHGYRPASSRAAAAANDDEAEKWTRLIDELQLDLDRVSTRNLGRDDRVVSDTSREVRYPFLASPVVRFVADLAVWDKCDPRFEEGLGDKLLLRMLVRDLMRHDGETDASGSGNAWRLKKRAIHFGARTAKMELDSGGAKGTDRL